MPDENIGYAVQGVDNNNESTNYLVKQHDDDVIFSRESLEEFIRLIQRQGINNLTIYSVSDLLAGDKYKTITVRDQPPSFSHKPLEFELKELKDRKGYFVFVRYSFCWEGGSELNFGTEPDQGMGEEKNGEYFSLNQLNGRHVFVKTVNDVHFYAEYLLGGGLNTKNSSLFHEQISKDNPIPSIVGDNADYMKNGTFTITIDNIQDVIKIKGFNDDGEYIGVVKRDTSGLTPEQITATQGQFLRGDGVWTNTLLGNYNVNNILPNTKDTYDIGAADNKWNHIYANQLHGALDGTAARATADQDGRNIKDTYGSSLGIDGHTVQLKRPNGDILSSVTVPDNDTRNTAGATGSNAKLFLVGAPNQGSYPQTYTNGYVYTQSGYLYANRVYNAVFNDYAECRTTIDLEPGRVVVDNDDGTMSCANTRLQPGAQIISDTFGTLMGETENAKTPIAVAGRVLVYPYQDRYNYHAGMAVCSAPNGTVDIMTREEIKNYPDCIVGIVSEIPEYEEWGTNKIKVNNRIWIKVK